MGLAPHRWRSFKLSNDKASAAKLHDVVGLYVSPPAHAIVLSVGENSRIQALDRTQPGLPLKRGRGATMTHDYKRNGTTTLLAALDVPLGADVMFVAERGRGVLPQTDPSLLEGRRLPLRRRPSGRHQPLHQGA